MKNISYVIYIARTLIRLIVIGAISFCPSPSSADVIKLINGDVISGKLAKLSPTECEFTTIFQNTVRVEKKLITELATDSVVAVKMESGELVFGRIDSLLDGILSIQSPSMGVVAIPLEKITLVQYQNVFEEDKGPDSGKLQEKTEHIDKKNEHSLGKKVQSPPQTFLRGNSLSLLPGQVDVSSELDYSPNGAGNKRSLTLTEGISVGILDRLEALVQVPLSVSDKYPRDPEREYNEGNRNNILERLRSDSYRFGLRDVRVGCRYLLKSESSMFPEITGSLSCGMPTSNANFDRSSWSVSTGVSFVKSADPATIFWGMGYTNYFEYTVDGETTPFREEDDFSVKKGDRYNYYAGVGFAINDRLSVSSRFVGEYNLIGTLCDLQTKRKESYGANSEPMVFGVGFSYRAFGETIIDPELIFGLNGDSGREAGFSIKISRKF